MTATATAAAAEEPAPLEIRLRISSLWIATMFVFVYVDLFSLYRPDFRSDLDEGRVHTFDVGEAFLLLTTLYVVVPSLMVVLTLMMRPRLNRNVNIVVAMVFALTVIASAIGEWWYFVFGSAVELALLVGVVVSARRLVEPADERLVEGTSLERDVEPRA